MNDIRKYINLIESYEKLDEASRGDAIKAIQNYAYQISYHMLKACLFPGHNARNHWIVEIRTYLHAILRKKKKAKIKLTDIEAALAHDAMTYQSISKMLSDINQNYEYITTTPSEVETLLSGMIRRIAELLDRNVHIDYSDINVIIDTARF